MKKSLSCKNLPYVWVEKNGPICIAILFTIIAVYVRCKFSLGAGFGKILDATVVFASIMVGFVGVLMGVLFSIRDADLIKLFFQSRGIKMLKRYFRENIISSIALVVLSIVLYLKNYLGCFDWIVYTGWSYLLAFTLFSAVRIIHIIFHIVFAENDIEEDEDVNIDGAAKEKLKEQLSHRRK